MGFPPPPPAGSIRSFGGVRWGASGAIEGAVSGDGVESVFFGGKGDASDGSWRRMWLSVVSSLDAPARACNRATTCWPAACCEPPSTPTPFPCARSASRNELSIWMGGV
eukprot:CAMPEP_0174727834 /NCGR_PEP_ID=MMETSP1094-20130205/50580_1 /TAXON_ID=156173 /ORGANISM="Chrysochromulina brevifilum, Strain UTEX LB 985" /LENGTH=108 /DNA_ID=CAMNT_0015929661 /DNA_START=223 /DNA_END=549 /DNA_ORIENTATION=-